MTQSVDRIVLPPAFGDRTQLPEREWGKRAIGLNRLHHENPF